MGELVSGCRVHVIEQPHKRRRDAVRDVASWFGASARDGHGKMNQSEVEPALQTLESKDKTVTWLKVVEGIDEPEV